MQSKKEILDDFKLQVLEKLHGIRGYGISFDTKRIPFIFVDVKSKDYKRLSHSLPHKFNDIDVKVRITAKSRFLSGKMPGRIL